MELLEIDFDLADLENLAGGESRHGDFTGTKALMLAVLEDGIRSYLGTLSRAALEAEHWVQSAHRQSPFSFVVVCETLNLNPDAVRRVLARMREQRVPARKALPRARPNVRMTTRLCTRRRG
ncbi:MAG TPA: hypothetical protein VL403_14010 [Candidatus Kryptonia bacterium]|nr:hypothetical protein [Candidatus Kryptonia bacterium]